MLYNKALLSRSLNTHTYTHTPYTIYTRSIYFFNSLNISGRVSVCVCVCPRQRRFPANEIYCHDRG